MSESGLFQWEVTEEGGEWLHYVTGVNLPLTVLPVVSYKQNNKCWRSSYASVYIDVSQFF